MPLSHVFVNKLISFGLPLQQVVCVSRRFVCRAAYVPSSSGSEIIGEGRSNAVCGLDPGPSPIKTATDGDKSVRSTEPSNPNYTYQYIVSQTNSRSSFNLANQQRYTIVYLHQTLCLVWRTAQTSEMYNNQ